MRLQGTILGVVAGVGVMSAAGWVHAQEAPQGAAQGLLLQTRLQAQSGLLSVGGGSSFLIGYQARSFALGLGAGLSRLGVSAGSNGSASLTLLQVVPTVLVDVWHSRDRRARANLVGGVGYGRGWLDSTLRVTTCSGGSSDACSARDRKDGASVHFVPFLFGFGGDYFLGRNFALGAEMGLQSALSVGLEVTSDGTSRSVGASGNLQSLYGALRASFVLGN